MKCENPKGNPTAPVVMLNTKSTNATPYVTTTLKIKIIIPLFLDIKLRVPQIYYINNIFKLVIEKNTNIFNNQFVNRRNAELEIVNYNTHDIGHVTDNLIRSIVNFSGIGGTKRWPQMWHQLMLLIKDHTAFKCLWEANGMDVIFSFFLDPRPTIINDRLIFRSPEPRIAFVERPEFVRPPVKTYISRVIEEIAEEMQDVYHLRIGRDPLSLDFPQEKYAKRIDRFNVPLLTP